MIISNDLINEIRSKTDIVDIISEYISLTKKGKNYFGVCPFHDDHSPSMSVSSEKQIYTCFSCGAGGNVFTFVQDYEHLSFVESVKLIGDKVGITVDTKGIKKVDKYEKIYEMYGISHKFYMNNLRSALGKKALSYLEKRDINNDIINEYEIGLALKNTSLTSLLNKKGYDTSDILKYGLCNEAYNDIFFDRIMFPLWDINGNVVGYSGRIYDTNDDSKYVNTKETNIFKKGTILYNYHKAKDEARKKSFVIVCEGFMDVIRFYSVGIKNVVATMGTAFTKEQALLLKKLSNNVILCFDGDKAGEKATIAAISLLEEMDFNIKVIKLEDNMDPDDYIIKNGEKNILNKIETAYTLLEYKMQLYKKDKNMSIVTDQSEYLNSVLKELSVIDDVILRDLSITKLAKEFDITTDILNDKLKLLLKNKKLPNKVITPPKVRKYSKYEKAERLLVYYMIKNPDIIDKYERNISYLPTKEIRFLVNELIYFQQNSKVYNVADFISFLDNKKELSTVLINIMNEDYKEDYKEEEIDDYIKVLSKYVIEVENKRLESLLKEESNIDKQKELLTRIIELKKENK